MKCQVRKSISARRTGLAGVPLGSVLLAALLTSAAPALQAQMGVVSYDCQVETELGVHGLVMVQTDNSEAAERIASSSMATTVDERQARSISVIQCVKRGEKRFTDLAFRRFAENLPR